MLTFKVTAITDQGTVEYDALDMSADGVIESLYRRFKDVFGITVVLQ